MTGVVTYLVRDGVAIVEIDNPPLNALSPPIRRDLDAALKRAIGDDEVTTLVLRARGRTFGGATDPNASSSSSKAPPLDAICARIDASPKPVIAALHGTVLGNGADLALAAHYRVALSGTHLGFPEARLGLLPGGGATQRLPRLVGAEVALAMLETGRAVAVGSGRRNGLADRVVHDKAGVASFALAKELAAKGAPPRPASVRTERTEDPVAWLDAVAMARAGLPQDALPVRSEVVNCVEAALLLPYEEGLAFEQTARETLRVSDIAAALCHMARAERKAALVPSTLGAEPRGIDTVGVIGADSAGIGLTVASLDAGLSAILSTDDEVELEEAYAAIGEIFDARQARGDASEADIDARLDRLTMVCGHQAFAAADIVIDTASSDTATAIAMASRLDAATPAGAVLVATSAGVSLEMLAKSTSRPADVLGLRIFGRAQRGAGAELVTLATTSRHAVATVFALLRQFGKLPVVSVDPRAGGGIAARLTAALHAAADALVLRGAEAEAIDAALTGWGLAEGVFEARARRGLPVDQAVLRLAAGGDGGPIPTGAGQFPAPRKLSPDTITRTCLAAVVNEGARLLADGVARRPSDIDLLAVQGLGYARRTGGPMQAGDRAGLLSLRRALPRLGESGGIGGTPAPLLDELIKNGRGFDSLNAG